MVKLYDEGIYLVNGTRSYLSLKEQRYRLLQEKLQIKKKQRKALWPVLF